MLELTRLNGNRFFVNSDLIQYAEAAPDTVLTLVTGEKLVVSETCGQVVAAALAYRSQVLRATWPDAAAALTARTAHDAATSRKPSQNGPIPLSVLEHKRS